MVEVESASASASELEEEEEEDGTTGLGGETSNDQKEIKFGRICCLLYPSVLLPWKGCKGKYAENEREGIRRIN